MRNILNHLVRANLCVRPTCGNMRNAVAQYSFRTTVLLLLAIIIGCEESKRFEISGSDNTPPGTPIFIESQPLSGGARIFFQPPPDLDVLYIEASYQNVAGKLIRFAASFAAGSVDVYGLDRAGEHQIVLCAVDRAGNRSENVNVTIIALEPIVVTVANSVDVLSSFASMLVRWQNESEDPLYVWVDISYTQNGVRREHTTVFNTYQTETRSIEGLNLFDNEPVSVKVTVRDKFDQLVLAKDTTIVLLIDAVIPKEGWKFPDVGTEMGDISQVNGLRMDVVKDGLYDIDAENYFFSLVENPWNLIIDLGDEYEISRILTHQRWSGYNASSGVVVVRGNLYRGDNILSSNLYGWDKVNQTWELFSRRVIIPPVVSTEGAYTIMGQEGDMDYIYPDVPQFSKPTRFFRVEAINGSSISEITLYGRKAQ